MPRPLTILASLLALAALLGLGSKVADWTYFSRRDALQQRIDGLRERVATYRTALDDHPRVRQEMHSFVERTLGGDLETVDHRLRSRLNRIAEEEGLADRVVGTGSASTHRSPARSSFSRSGAWREMRDEIDFVELDAWISGAGTLEQAIRLIDRVVAEPWLKRIDEITLDPHDNGDRVDVTLRLTTLFLPGRSPAAPPARPYDPARLARLASFVETNPFRLPPEAPPRRAVVEAAASPSVEAFAWSEWLVTGLAQGPHGGEAWLQHRSSGETKVLQAGARLGDASFEGIQGEWGVFQLEEGRFMVQVGWDLSQRQPAPQ